MFLDEKMKQNIWVFTFYKPALTNMSEKKNSIANRMANRTLFQVRENLLFIPKNVAYPSSFLYNGAGPLKRLKA